MIEPEQQQTVIDRMFDANAQTEYTNWTPEPGHTILLPSRLPENYGTIVLPESYTKKNNSGICIKCGLFPGIEYRDAIRLGLECFFPSHSEFQIVDSDTGYLLYLIPTESILMSRVPPKDIARVSREKGKGLLALATIEHPTPAA